MSPCLLSLSLVTEEVAASPGPEYTSTFHSPWRVFVCGGGGWSLKGAVSVPSLHARVPLHAGLQNTALLRGARVHRAEWNGGPEAQKSAFSQQRCLGTRETDLAPGAFTVLPLGQYWVNK